MEESETPNQAVDKMKKYEEELDLNSINVAEVSNDKIIDCIDNTDNIRISETVAPDDFPIEDLVKSSDQDDIVNKEEDKCKTEVNYVITKDVKRNIGNKKNKNKSKIGTQKSKKRWQHKCPICGQNCNNTAKLKQHLKKHSNVPIFQCALCEHRVKSNMELIEHKSVHKSEERIFMCEECQEAFSEFSDFLIHNIKHEQNVYIKCLECNQCFRKHYYGKHLLNHYNANIKCEKCAKSFATIHLYDLHIQSHSNSLECVECGRIYKNRVTMDYHMLEHTGVKPFQCLYCGRGFKAIAQVKIHTRIHTNEKPFKCKICKKSFRQYTDFHNHKERHENKRYECDQCEKSYTLKQSLTFHMRIHNNYRPYECPDCDKKFCMFADLKRHTVRYHTTLRNFECGICDMKFILKRDLKRHVQTKAHKNLLYSKEQNSL